MSNDALTDITCPKCKIRWTTIFVAPSVAKTAKSKNIIYSPHSGEEKIFTCPKCGASVQQIYNYCSEWLIKVFGAIISILITFAGFHFFDGFGIIIG